MSILDPLHPWAELKKCKNFEKKPISRDLKGFTSHTKKVSILDHHPWAELKKCKNFEKKTISRDLKGFTSHTKKCRFWTTFILERSWKNVKILREKKIDLTRFKEFYQSHKTSQYFQLSQTKFTFLQFQNRNLSTDSEPSTSILDSPHLWANFKITLFLWKILDLTRFKGFYQSHKKSVDSGPPSSLSGAEKM